MEAVHEIHEAVVALHLDRFSLFSGVTPGVVATIRDGAMYSEQVLLDLHALTIVDRLADETDPLRIWLLNAKVLAGPRNEAAVFDRHLQVATLTPEKIAADIRRARQDPLQPLVLHRHKVIGTKHPSLLPGGRIREATSSIFYLLSDAHFDPDDASMPIPERPSSRTVVNFLPAAPLRPFGRWLQGRKLVVRSAGLPPTRCP